MSVRAFVALGVEWRKADGVSTISTRQHYRSVGSSPASLRARALPRAALLAGVSLAALATLIPNAAHAIDGTWSGPGAEWTDGTNWSSTPEVPDDTATFTNNGAPTSVTISNDALINTIQFTDGAPAFDFTTSGTGITFNINGSGIVNNSAFAPSFTNNDNLNFNGISSAGNAVIINNSVVSFNNNSTAGNATITTSNGALTQFNDNSTAGSAAIINTDGGTVSFNNNSTAAYATITTSNGALTQFNDNSTGGNAQFITNAGGTVDFSSTSGPAGDGNISAGSIAGAGNYYLGSNQLTVGSNNLNTTVSGVISDCGDSGLDCSNAGATGGGLIKVGTGTLTLSGANTYSGPTSVNAGTLQAGAVNAFSPASAFTVLSGASLDLAGFNQTIGSLAGAGIVTLGSATLTTNGDGSDTTFSGTISGSGRLVKVGAGTLTLSGNNSYQGGTFLNEGTLAVGSSRALGTGALTLADGTTLQAAATGLVLANTMRLNGDVTLDTQSNLITLSGPISGTGGLDKIGSGTLRLTGASTYTGTTNVSEGVLNVNGSLVSTVCVCSGGMLTGTGTIGGLSVGGGGTVAPGNSIGTLSVRGNVNFDVDGIYQVKTNAAGQSDKISATGAATIAGGTVQVLAQGGTYARQTRYTILTASAGVSGKFADVTSNLAFLMPLLSYDPRNVVLTLVRNDVTFAAVARTPNQRAVADALDRSPPLQPLVQAVANLSSAGALQAFDALSGEVHGSAQTTMIDDSRYVRQAVLGRLRQAPYAGEASAMAALATGGPMLAYADPAADRAPAYPDGYSPAYPINAPFAAPVHSPDLTFWAQGVGAWGKINSDGNAADVARNLGGVFTGFDRRFGEWRAGFAGGYTNSSASVSARASSANIDTAYLAAYGGASFGPLNFRSGAVFAWHTIATNRSIVFPGFAEQASARYSAAEGQAFGEFGYGMSFGSIAAEPFVGLAWVQLNTDSFTETGGVSALTGASSKDGVGFSTVGARWASNYLMPNGMMLTPRASLAWQHAFGTVPPTATLTFQNTGTAFGIWGAPIARDAALVEAGGDLHLSTQTKVGIFYAGQLATSTRDHSVKGNFTWQF
jgi:outer membrane autotransporter protein